MKLKNKTKYFNQKGITLIALVVTIVVLLILAGVSINALFGDSGIINKAKNAQDKANESVQKDMEQINTLENWIDKATGQTSEKATKKLELAISNALNGRATFNINELKAEIEKYDGTVKGIKPAEKIPVAYQFPVTVTLDNTKFAVENNRQLLENRRN